MFTINELQFIRGALDIVTIKGADAQFLAQLQLKIEKELTPPPPAPKDKQPK